MLFASKNDRIQGVRWEGGTDKYGQSTLEVVDYLALANSDIDPKFVGLPVWTNFNIGRYIEIRGIGSEVTGELEIDHQYLMQLRAEHKPTFGVGDEVRFSSRVEWFILGQFEQGAGMFSNNQMYKFNLIRSHRA
jgi:hypothetical protein